MRLNIHTKLLASLFLLVTISLGSMGYVLLRDANNRLDEFQLLQAKSQARTLAESSQEPLLVQEYALIENLVDVAISEEQYAYAAVVSPSGLVYSHTDINLVGRNIPTLDQPEEDLVHVVKYQGRSTEEIVYPIKIGGDHLGNAHIAYFLDVDYYFGGDAVAWIINILILTFAVLMLGSLLITRTLIHPLTKLTQVVNDSFSDKRLIIDPGILDRTDEVGALSRAFKGMSDQLVERLEELEYQIQERNHARAESATKSTFLSNVSHELRTPLNAIIGYSELLIDMSEEDGRNEYKDDLLKICNSGKHLNNVVDDMLDLSKIEAGKMDIQLAPIDIRQLMSDVVTTFAPLLDKNNNKLHQDISLGVKYVLADPLRIKQVLLNLLSNATKFTSDGEIYLNVTSKQDKVEFTITDTGIGMSSEVLGKVFNAFTQADKTTTIRYGGTGLGLTISRRLCQLMGGALTATSQEGRGSVFRVLLPASQDSKIVD